MKYSCELFISLSMYIAKVLINYTCWLANDFPRIDFILEEKTFPIIHWDLLQFFSQFFFFLQFDDGWSFFTPTIYQSTKKVHSSSMVVILCVREINNKFTGWYLREKSFSEILNTIHKQFSLFSLSLSLNITTIKKKFHKKIY